MVRALSIVVLTLFIGQAAGLSDLVEADECAQPCLGDSPDGQCPPSCQFCVCCPTLRPAVLSHSPAILPNQASRTLIGEQTETPPSPAPRGILHVPKRSLA